MIPILTIWWLTLSATAVSQDYVQSAVSMSVCEHLGGCVVEPSLDDTNRLYHGRCPYCARLGLGSIVTGGWSGVAWNLSQYDIAGRWRDVEKPAMAPVSFWVCSRGHSGVSLWDRQ